MRTTFFAALAAAVLCIDGTALAADLSTNGGLKDNPASSSGFWTGYYAGMHSGAAIGTNTVADPFGPSIFGDHVRTTGEFGGAQIGYNYQMGQLVAGVEADASWANLDGTNTCFAASAYYLSANCHTHIDAFGTLTARLGTTVGPAGSTLLYVKGGAAWENIKLESANIGGLVFDPPLEGTGTSASETKWGWTVGAGLEHALTGRWSVKVEYDYLKFGDSGFAAPNSAIQTGFPGSFDTVASAATHFSNDLHIIKAGTNYKLTGLTGSLDDEVASLKDTPMSVAPSWQVEFGARYAGNWGRFQKDLGATSAGYNLLASRLTYDNMWANGGELFGRIDTASNIMVKGYVGLGSGNSGHMNDEDWMLGPPDFAAWVPYSNTVSNIDQEITYGTIDAGYDYLRGDGYKVAPFAGYTVFRQDMKAMGCVQISHPYSDCVGADIVPTSVTGITEKDTWQAVRLGSSFDVMLSPQLKLTAEAAWLPYVWFTGTDNHLLRSLVSPESGRGSGAQTEASLSYAVTPEWSVGIGGRYSAIWTSSGNTNFGGTGTIVPMRYAVEQATGFAQISYKFTSDYQPLK
jgi:opacity protein-like surface antigen